MTLNPITVVDQVLEEYRAYLSTEFRASDTRLRQELEAALNEPGFLAQEPFFQAHRPFKAGAAWSDLPLDAALARVMVQRSGSRRTYRHQSESIAHLLSDQAGPLVVTTGTGSGKTECFLLPVIQNAIEDSVRFKQRGITAILIYPMNALANDQEERIQQYLQGCGHTHVKVARYDRSTQQEERERLRKRPPHILLTNYMMLEYLLVRPADRDALFANHRCRFVVLDEVHTYRGSLGANVALLFRRLLTHLRHARQDWNVTDPGDPHRFPEPLAVATSATIKSVDEAGKGPEEVRRLRNEAVREFLSKLTGLENARFKVLGEEIEDITIPPEAVWPPEPVAIDPPAPADSEALRDAVAALAGGTAGRPLPELARRTAIFWKLGEMLAKRPMSLGRIARRIREEVPARRAASLDAIRREVQVALVAGAALPDDVPGALRLRTHRFIRGGWRFMRCVDPACGRLYPKGEEQCTCRKPTAPLYLCRSCGADTLRFKSGSEGPEAEALRPNADRGNDDEWILYDRERFEAGEVEGLVGMEKQMRKRPVLQGSFDPTTCSFATDETTYGMRVALAPARNRCLVCGGTAGSHDVITPVALGTSAAVRVLSEGLVEALATQNEATADHDGKQRLLIFSDSRQDAAHQARFITYAGRYDRMRRRVVRALDAAPDKRLTVDEVIKALVVQGVERNDNPRCKGYDEADWLPEAVQQRARAWEEAPLLDDLAVSVGYRASLFNLGLVGVFYQHLDRHVEKNGAGLCVELGIEPAQLAYLCRCTLDEMRRRSAVSRPMLAYHPSNPSCPDEFKGPADWERRIKNPAGYAAATGGAPVPYLDKAEIPSGITLNNAWRKPRAGGRGPSLERRMRHLLARMGGEEPSEDSMAALLEFLCGGPRLLLANKLHGHRKPRELLQVNAEAISLDLLAPEDRFTCSVCNVRLAGKVRGFPCPNCHGTMNLWPASEVDGNRYVQRIRKADRPPLVAGEHTAQITGLARIDLEEDFKGPPGRSPINVLACSPTLEMGIDVGGLDAVVMRNVPPRPDNYAQRGGRAGRRTRTGVVIGYARNTPHDGYFFDKPAEMIAGEIAAPGIGLGNRDVVLRHLFAIAFGLSEPGLAGRMGEYINIQGLLDQDKVDELIGGLSMHFDRAAQMAIETWGSEILSLADLDNKEALRSALDRLPDRIRDLFDRVRFQIVKLQETIDRWNELGKGDRSAIHAQALKRKLLGIRDDRHDREADDRSGGHPMRRFAEFGILPGYEFPSEPATIRLWGDRNEEDPISVARRFGIAQYQPGARAHARGHRWRVVGLDLASPWNPKSPEPDWLYLRCKQCNLRYDAQTPSCPRCGSDETIGRELPGHEYGGFLAIRDDTPVLQEEDRFAIAALIGCHPQRDGRILSRVRLPTGWTAVLREEESVRWVNEWKPRSEQEKRLDRPCLHDAGRGFYLCPSCGRSLSLPDESGTTTKGRKKAKRGRGRDPYDHATGCERSGEPPKPAAITTMTPSTTLRVEVNLPADFDDGDYLRWGYSLGYSLRTGMRGLYMLDGPELEFHLEPTWLKKTHTGSCRYGALTFIDAAVGGSGFLDHAAAEFHLVAKRAIEHLDHPNCESACYRCLKSYRNQRHHEHLSWHHVMPDLEVLAKSAPVLLGTRLGDCDDPKPWLDSYDAGVGSPLELKFLRLFERYGLEIEKQVPVAADSGGTPIGQADFRVTGSKVLIYVDGAAFHQGTRLRRDRIIRRRLRDGGMGWRIVEVKASDLGRGEELVLGLREMAAAQT